MNFLRRSNYESVKGTCQTEKTLQKLRKTFASEMHWAISVKCV